ncbi:MAG: hypothetical protein WCO63_09200 [Bacteroidota bacterium]
MKKQIFAIVILIASIGFAMSSCDKKKSANPMNMDIQMTYTPNPAKVDSIVTFTFNVTESGMMSNVDTYSCDVVMGASSDTMTITHMGTGIYNGTRKFNAAGTYEMHFNYMMMGSSGDMHFPCVVQ